MKLMYEVVADVHHRTTQLVFVMLCLTPIDLEICNFCVEEIFCFS